VSCHEYIMESPDEIKRLEMKTDFAALERQALWAGLAPGMRVADIGCGSGITTEFLKRLTGPSGEVVGIDQSEERLAFAGQYHGGEGISFARRDIYGSLEGLGGFDFIWVRFLLEYHRSRQFELVQKLAGLLNPGGILCLVDLDFNSINHAGWTGWLKQAVEASVACLETRADFDPYAGKRLYGHVYDLGLEEIQVKVETHHLIYGELKGVDSFNWLTKVVTACRESGYSFSEYPGGFEEFYQECRTFFSDPRRFTYTPLIVCRGVKPFPET